MSTTAFIQAVAMAWLPLSEMTRVCFLWTTPEDWVSSRETKCWVRKFYQESRKANLRCLARNICEEVRSELNSFNFPGKIICNECSFFYGMSLQDLEMLNQVVREAGSYQRLAAKFQRTGGLTGHFAEFEADSEWREVFIEQEASQAVATAELVAAAVVLEKLEKKEKEEGNMETEQTQAQEQAPKKSKGPVGPCEIFLNGRSLWKDICHWSVARKKAREVKAEVGEIDLVELFEGGKKIPPEKWDKTLALPVLKKNSAKEKKSEKTAEKEPEIAVPIKLGTFYRKFVLESIVRLEEVTPEELASGRVTLQEIPAEEMRELLRKGAGL